MKIPVIRGKIGDWHYYSGVMTFKDISDHVTPSINELFQSTCLDDLLQRELTDNYNSIKEYLLTDPERFFNAIILAIYDGDPQWLEVEFEESEKSFTNVGFLQFNGNETIFPVDGQHRVKGIIEALKENNELSSEQVPVIFIAHSKTDDGRKRTRKLFSTLNRRAKPVGKNENIALDEDDVCSIITRELVQSHPLFKGENVINSQGKQIPSTNRVAFTSLLTLYQCVDLIVQWKMELSKEKYKSFLLYRPAQNIIDELSSMVSTFFDSFAANTTVLQDYLGDTSEARASRFRNSSGGNLLFRPVALTEYCSVALSLVKISSLDWDSTFQTLNRLPQQINEGPWLGLIWDGEKIINRVSRPVIKALLCYMTDCSLLSEKQRDKFYAEYSKALNITKGQAETRLHSFREWSKK